MRGFGFCRQSGVEKYIQKVLSDERTNSIIIMANQDAMKAVKDLIARLDVDVDPCQPRTNPCHLPPACKSRRRFPSLVQSISGLQHVFIELI